MIAILPLVMFSLAAAGESPLSAAEKSFQELEFDKSARLFQKALERPATLDERVREWKGLGLSAAFQGLGREAKAAFEKLLLIDPAATVDASMGPKISAPFAAAKEALGRRRNALALSRDADGAVWVKLTQDVPLAIEVSLHARAKGAASFTVSSVKAGRPLSLPFAPAVGVEAFAEAKDAHGGVVLAEGSQAAPRLLGAAAAVPAAVALAVEEARHEADGTPTEAEPDDATESEGFGHWPLVIGLAAAAGAGIAVGVVASQPPALKLPAADRTGRLP